jgi:hypothetical protein
MSVERLFTFRNPWFAAGVGIAGAIVMLSLVAGFVILPYATTNTSFASLWDAICSAAGVPRATAISELPKSTMLTSYVVMNSPDIRSDRHTLRGQRRYARYAMRDLSWIEPAGPGRYAKS